LAPALLRDYAVAFVRYVVVLDSGDLLVARGVAGVYLGLPPEARKVDTCYSFN